MLSLTPPQQTVLDHGLLTSGFNTLLQMPTGSGKTWLAEYAIAQTLAEGKRAIYLTPLRALAQELVERWRKRFADSQVGVFTGDFGIPGSPYPVPFTEAQLLIMTPERLDACSRAWRSHWHWIPEVDLLVIDEFHLLGEGQRGARLEGVILRMQRLNPFLRIVGLSATLGNRQELADWLEGVEFSSSWRPIQIDWRLVYYRRASEKPELLLAEVRRIMQEGGKSLVFVQSRRRAEEMSRYLTGAGIEAQHHHAGLSHPERAKVEKAFREGNLNVLVATATLEMGLNLPARQVVLYDLQRFDGVEFRALSTNVVWQRIGRAGRPGLDPTGEAVLLVPSWDRHAQAYAQGCFEPILSVLQSPAALAEQIVTEIASGLCRSEAQLESAFSHSLAAKQRRLPNLHVTLQTMIDAGMVKRRSEETDNGRIFVVTKLGRIAVRHFLAPASVLCFQRVLSVQQPLSFFDLLLLVTSSLDCEPLLPVDFEELDEVAALVATQPSYLLQGSRQQLTDDLGIDGKRLLSALKMALVLRCWTQTGDAEEVGKQNDCYPFEVARLCESAERLLLAMFSIAAPGEEESTLVASSVAPNVEDNEFVAHHRRIGALQKMVAAGLDEVQITLTLVDGIGSAYARRLCGAGISDLEELAQAEPATVAAIPGISQQRAKKWIEEASQLLTTHSAFSYKEHSPKSTAETTHWQAEIDPYRLRRALELQVKGLDAGTYLVTGGLEPHRIQMIDATLRCDCADALRGHLCKHLLAVQLAQGDANIKRLASQLKQDKTNRSLNLFNLWVERMG